MSRLPESLAIMDEESELSARARLGTVLRSKYRLDRVLGVGGMAVVYAATHRNQKQFAVKMLHTELSIRQDIRSRFLREGYAANALQHPGSVAVLDDDIAEDGSAFLVMELLDGGVIDSLWEERGRRLPPRAVLAMGHQLLDVLAAAHAAGIVHRDIKPPNLFLTRDGTLKVLDFGIARVRDAMTGGGQTTGTGMLLGTPAYMPPEQALSKSSEIDGQSDVWAAGATLFSLLSGHLVHEGENPTQLLIASATVRARSVATVAPDAPAPVVEVIDRALMFDKPARWPTAEAMRDAIADAYVAAFGEEISHQPLLELLPPRPASFPPGRASAEGRPPSGSARRTPSPQTPAATPSPAVRPASSPSIDAPRFATDPTTSAPSAAVSRSAAAARTPIGPAQQGSMVGVSSSSAARRDSSRPSAADGKRGGMPKAALGGIAVALAGMIAFAAFELRPAATPATAVAAAGHAAAPAQEPAASPPPATTPQVAKTDEPAPAPPSTATVTAAAPSATVTAETHASSTRHGHGSHAATPAAAAAPAEPPVPPPPIISPPASPAAAPPPPPKPPPPASSAKKNPLDLDFQR